MSEEFEVRGAHEDRMDEAAEHEPKGMAGQLAVMTAILATVGAMFSYMAGATQAEASSVEFAADDCRTPRGFLTAIQPLR